MKQKHILEYDDDKLTKKIIDSHEQAKYFIKKVLSFKIEEKAYLNMPNYDNTDKYISLEQVRQKIPNLNEKLCKMYYDKLLYFSEVHGVSSLKFIPILVNNNTFEIYIKFVTDIYDKKKVKDFLEGFLHVVGEGEQIISYKGQDYYFLFE